MTCTSEICWSDKICCHSILSEQLLYGYDMYIRNILIWQNLLPLYLVWTVVICYDMYTRNMLIWQNLLPLYLVWTVVIWLWHVHQKYADLTKFAATLSCLNSCYMAMTCTPEICWSDKICCHSILSKQLLYGYDMYTRNMLIWQNLLPLYLV